MFINRTQYPTIDSQTSFVRSLTIKMKAIVYCMSKQAVMVTVTIQNSVTSVGLADTVRIVINGHTLLFFITVNSLGGCRYISRL